MTDKEYGDLVWAKVQSLMPRCPSCFNPRQPGRMGDHHILVCTNCSDFAALDPEWVGQIVDRAYEEVDRELEAS